MSSEELYLLAVDKEDNKICIAISDYRNTDVKKVNIIYGTTAKFVYNAIRGIKSLKETRKELNKKRKEKHMIKVKTDETNVGIKWRDYSKNKPFKEGWYLTIELPKYYDLERFKDPNVRYYACVVDKNRAGPKPKVVFRLNLAYNEWFELGYLRLKSGKSGQ